MPYCPFISYQKQYTSTVDCMEGECMFWDAEHRTCLGRTALLRAVDNGKEIAELKQRINSAALGFGVMPS